MKSAHKSKKMVIELCEMQSRLNLLSGSSSNLFSDMVWTFFTPHGAKFVIDFGILNVIKEQNESWFASLEFDLYLATKVAWIDTAEIVAIERYKIKLTSLALFWSAMASNKLNQLSKERLGDVLSHILMHGWENGRLLRRPKIYSRATFQSFWSLDSWQRSLNSLGLESIIPNISHIAVRHALAKLIPELTTDALTYSDWDKGGSYNQLTLDVGQHYVEHCHTYFEENIALALAVDSVLSISSDISQTEQVPRKLVDSWVRRFLQGASAEQLAKPARTTYSDINTIRKVYQLVLTRFLASFREARFSSIILKQDTLHEFALKLGLEANQSDIDRLRLTTAIWMEHAPIAETTALLHGFNPAIAFSKFKANFDLLQTKSFQQPCDLPTEDQYHTLGVRYPHELVRSVRAAGLTSIVALTGWRKSEFGFPVTAMQSSTNDDKLDQYAFPKRFEIEWYVFKSTGNLPVRREITFGIALLIKRLALLVGAPSDRPCLFPRSDTVSDVFDSTVALRAVSHLWGHFVHHYPPFLQLDQLSTWETLSAIKSRGMNLSAEQRKSMRRLLSIRSSSDWKKLSIDRNLREVWRRCRREWPALNFVFMDNSAKVGWLVKYRDRTLRKDLMDILDAGLSEEMRSVLDGLSNEEIRAQGIVKVFSSDLLAGCLYPTPHAFRHMWAEAIYRRFDGDAGWLIRSQFKHIARAMWLAYIRDKDNRAIHQSAKIQVITSLVYNYLERRGMSYTGQFHVWLRRLMKKTKVATPAEKVDLAAHLSRVEIVDIKANPWGYCVLKRRTISKARCAEMGEPQRHNASPDLCLGCVHNLMQPSNVDWLLLNAYTHVEMLKNSDIPSLFTKSSYRLICNLTQHLKILDPQHEALAELNETLESYRNREIVS